MFIPGKVALLLFRSSLPQMCDPIEMFEIIWSITIFEVNSNFYSGGGDTDVSLE